MCKGSGTPTTLQKCPVRVSCPQKIERFSFENQRSRSLIPKECSGIVVLGVSEPLAAYMPQQFKKKRIKPLRKCEAIVMKII